MLRSYGITAAAIASSTADLSSALWQTFIQHSREKVCWKDPSHRIRGASRAFCAWLGIPEQELLGKTIRELGFCVDCQVDEETDETAMRTGQAVPGSSFHFIVKQQPHLVQIDKFPLYQHDRMAGVVLCCHDVEDVTHPQIDALHAAITDEETGLLNYRGMVMAGLRYADTYRLYGDDYTAALIDVPEFDAIGLTYGQGFRRHLLQKITAILKEYLPPALTLAHIGSCCFLLFQKSTLIGRLQQAHVQISNAIHAIQQVDGFPCTLYMHYAIVRGSEARSLDSLLQLLIKRMHESEEEQYGQALYTSDRFIFDRGGPLTIWKRASSSSIRKRMNSCTATRPCADVSACRWMRHSRAGNVTRCWQALPRRAMTAANPSSAAAASTPGCSTIPWPVWTSCSGIRLFPGMARTATSPLP